LRSFRFSEGSLGTHPRALKQPQRRPAQVFARDADSRSFRRRVLPVFRL